MGAALLTLAAVWFAAHVSPGPDFLMCVRMAATQSRRVALHAVAGIALGTACWALSAYYGVSILFRLLPVLANALRLVAGAYLLLLGARLLLGSLRAARADGPAGRGLEPAAAFRIGLLTSLTNPKAALFTTSLFAATLRPDPPAWFGPAASAVAAGITLGTYSALVAALTTRPAARVFARARHWLDRVAGALFIALGARFVLDR